ncbi:winged helix-turn-helix domain-containing protein [Ensifer sp. ENS09]|nr:winged helix-turn-helix domain-containing protein [Ensifer sp. ENS09]
MVTAFLRRRRPATGTVHEAQAEEPFFFEEFRLDVACRRLTSKDGREIALTTGEFEMLCTLVRHAGRVLNREILIDLTRGRSREAFDRVIDAQIARLRRKIEKDPRQPDLIKSVRRVGYAFSARAVR